MEEQETKPFPDWRNPEPLVDGRINCEIQHPKYGWIPFTANREDKGARFDVGAMMDEIEKELE